MSSFSNDFPFRANKDKEIMEKKLHSVTSSSSQMGRVKSASSVSAPTGAKAHDLEEIKRRNYELSDEVKIP